MKNDQTSAKSFTFCVCAEETDGKEGWKEWKKKKKSKEERNGFPYTASAFRAARRINYIKSTKDSQKNDVLGNGLLFSQGVSR